MKETDDIDEHGTTEEGTDLEVAVVGLAARVPGAADVAELWANLVAGVESVTFFSEAELAAAGVPPEVAADPAYIPARGVLAGADHFDAALFDVGPREAEILDPQQRLFLECAEAALADAAVDPARAGGPIGLFAGAGPSTYLARLLADPEVVSRYGFEHLMLANDKDYLATRVAWKLGLTGPAVTVQTACSTSLVAVHLACQSLLSGECDLALAGGVSVAFPQRRGYRHLEGGIQSPDGHCRAFDAAAAGTVSGYGVGVVVLERLAAARVGGSPIRAVVLGSAANNDGAGRIGFTAPSEEGQATVVRTAQRMAEVPAESVSYVEAHGTGTRLGDPIEIAALGRAFRAGEERPGGEGYCGVGSVKTNLGHLDAAAGVAGLIKTVLALEHRILPASLHFERPNPQIVFAGSPFRVVAATEPWSAEGPLRAGVSSFGLGGTNVHAVLEEAPPPVPSGPSRRWQLLPISAHTGSALETATDDLARYLEEHPEASVADVAHTLHLGRRSRNHRRVLVADAKAGAAAASARLRDRDPQRLRSAVLEPVPRRLAFLFPGVGDQWPGMGHHLYRAEPEWRRAFDRCAELLEPRLGLDLRRVLFAAGAAAAEAAAPSATLLSRGGPAPTVPEGSPLASLTVAQPALFAVQVAQARWLASLGVEPDAMLGYSLGEYVAAHLAGVFELADVLALVVERARCVESLPPGGMLAVPLSEAELERRLQAPGFASSGLAPAAVNGPELCVVAGPETAVEAFARELEGDGVARRRIAASHPFHTPAMEAVAGELRSLLARVSRRPPERPWISNLTGGWITAEEAVDDEYWVRHLCRPVRLADGLATLYREPGRVFLELGPGQALTSLALQNAPPRAEAGAVVAIPTLRGPANAGRNGGTDGDDLAFAVDALGRLWLAGVEMDAAALHRGESRRRLALPLPPFERQRYWLETTTSRLSEARPGKGVASVRASAVEDWLWLPSWHRTPLLPAPTDASPEPWWVLGTDGDELTATVEQRLEAAGHRVFRCRLGEGFRDWQRLLAEVAAEAGELPHVAYLWSLDPATRGDDREAWIAARTLGFDGFLGLARALARAGGRGPERRLVAVTSGVAAVERGDRIRPELALMLGPLRVLPREFPRVACRLVDVDPAEAPGEVAERLVGELLTADPGASLVAWRGRHRWQRCHRRAPLPSSAEPAGGLCQGGRYLITGGLGGVGLALGRHLAETLGARLVLLGRTPLPPRENWSRWLEDKGAEDGGAGDALRERLRCVLEVESSAAEVLFLTADVADRDAMAAAFEEIDRRFGGIDGVFHLAGVPGGGLIQLEESERTDAVLRPKVEGLRVLDELLRECGCELLVLYSSLVAATGALGQVSYAAANAFLDAWAEAREAEATTVPLRTSPARTVAIGWGEWRWDRWTADSGLDPRLAAGLARQRERYGLSFEEGFEAQDRILAADLPRVRVSTRDFRPFLSRPGAMLEALAGEEEAADASAVEVAADAAGRRPRPALGTPWIVPAGKAEERLAELWEDLLGIEGIGRDDDFLELGGHSLLALQMVSRLEQLFGVRVALQEVFERSTVAALAEWLADGATVGSEGEAGEAIKRVSRETMSEAELEGMSEAELDDLLGDLLEEERGEGSVP